MLPSRSGNKLRKSTSRTFPQVSAAGLPVQVAAVCYRVRGSFLEFLLVNTSAGKWTFPKGRIVPGLSGSESAASAFTTPILRHGLLHLIPCFVKAIRVPPGDQVGPDANATPRDVTPEPSAFIT